MKYIRTIGDILEDKMFDSPLCVFTREEIEPFIVNQADTIEELCDELVVIYKNNEKFKKPFTSVYDNLEDLLKEHDINECKVYGAIWTKNGLIYVAKMNENGDLELL